MPVPKGTRVGGRQKGSQNQKTKDIAEKIAASGCDPIHFMCLAVKNELQCAHCRATGKQRYTLDNPKNCPDCFGKGETRPDCKTCLGTGIKSWGIRVCLSCRGTLHDPCTPALRLQSAMELAGYLYSKRKAIEVSGPDGAEAIGIKVIFGKEP